VDSRVVVDDASVSYRNHIDVVQRVSARIFRNPSQMSAAWPGIFVKGIQNVFNHDSSTEPHRWGYTLPQNFFIMLENITGHSGRGCRGGGPVDSRGNYAIPLVPVNYRMAQKQSINQS